MKKWLWAGAASALVTTGMVAPTFASETQSYAYDPLGRLARVKYSGTINNGRAHSLCYDPAGKPNAVQVEPHGRRRDLHRKRLDGLSLPAV